MIAKTRRHSSSVTSTVRSDSPGTPAELTRMSIRPSASSAFATAAFTSAEDAMSPVTETYPSTGSRSKTATSAPPARSFSAVAAPMPLAPPVTSAIFPVKSYVFAN